MELSTSVGWLCTRLLVRAHYVDGCQLLKQVQVSLLQWILPIVENFSGSIMEDFSRYSALLSFLWAGVGNSLVYTVGAPYLDDSIQKKDSPIYFGNLWTGIAKSKFHHVSCITYYCNDTIHINFSEAIFCNDDIVFIYSNQYWCTYIGTADRLLHHRRSHEDIREST